MLPGQQYVPEDLLRIAWKRKWLIVVPFMAAAIGAVLVTNRLPNNYRSETLILVVPQRVPESYVKSTVTARIEDRLSSIQQQIMSRSRLERIIEDFNLYPEERERLVMEDVVERMRLDIEGPRIERGDAFRVGFVSKDARLAQRVTERLASLFIDENLRDRQVLAEGTNQFLDAELGDAKQRLVEHEKKLEQYRRQYAGQLPTQIDANLEAIRGAQMQLQALAEAGNRDQERQINLERQIADLEAEPVAPAPVLLSPSSEPAPDATTAQQLDTAIARLATLELRLKSEHPDIANAKRVIRDLQVRLDAENKQRPVPSGDPLPPVTSAAEQARRNRLRDLRTQLKDVQASLSAKQIESQRLRGVVDSYQARIDAAPTRESELTELTRDYTTLQNQYTSLLAKRQDSKISANLEQRQIGEQFKVLDPAPLPERPFSPNRLRINAMVTLGGLIFGLAIVALLEYRDSSFKTDDEVVRVLKLPVLALVPMMRSEREVHQKRRRRLLVGIAATVVVLASASAYAAWTLQVL